MCDSNSEVNRKHFHLHSKTTVCSHVPNVILSEQIILKTYLQSETDSILSLLTAFLLINAELLFPGYNIIADVCMWFNLSCY